MGVVEFSQLSRRDQGVVGAAANWTVDGKNGIWRDVTDPRYGTIKHVVVVGEDGIPKFDKLNIIWTPAVYVVAVRINPSGKAEFLLPSERRILLRDKNGNQGSVFVDGLPQGIIKKWEHELPHKAALRELMEETGYAPNSLVFLGNIAFTPANSEVEEPFYLAHVPYLQTPNAQILEDSETIHTENRWFTWSDIQRRPRRDGITLIGLYLAREVLKPELL